MTLTVLIIWISFNGGDPERVEFGLFPNLSHCEIASVPVFEAVADIKDVTPLAFKCLPAQTA